MEYIRYAYISVLGLLIVLSGCFGLTSDGSAEIAVAVVGQLLARIKSQDPEEATWRDA